MTKADPFEDLKTIKELGSNAIRTCQSLPKSVYDAARANGLFIVQGIHLQIDIPVGTCETLDLFDDFFEKHKAHVLAEIDDIQAAGGSDVILCHVVGNELSFCVQRATIRRNQARPRYDGRPTTPPGPAPPPCDRTGLPTPRLP
jgi:hypothetical protein